MEEQIWTHLCLHNSVIVRLHETWWPYSFAYPMETVMLFTLPLDTESSLSRFLAVICQSFWTILSAQWSNAECWNWCAFERTRIDQILDCWWWEVNVNSQTFAQSVCWSNFGRWVPFSSGYVELWSWNRTSWHFVEWSPLPCSSAGCQLG
jgi:hypothetical protein